MTAFYFILFTLLVSHNTILLVLFSSDSASFMSKSLTVDGNTIKYQIWDTAGQERVSPCQYYHKHQIMIYNNFSPSLIPVSIVATNVL